LSFKNQHINLLVKFYQLMYQLATYFLSHILCRSTQKWNQKASRTLMPCSNKIIFSFFKLHCFL